MNAAVVEAQSDSVADTVHIQNSFFLNAADALPQINSEITISGNNHTLSRAAGNTDDFSFIFVVPGGDVTVNNLTVSGTKDVQLANKSGIFFGTFFPFYFLNK